MNAAGLPPERRERLRQAIIQQRLAVGRVIKEMERLVWYGDDTVIQGLRAAFHALHGAVNAIPLEPRNLPSTGTHRPELQGTGSPPLGPMPIPRSAEELAELERKESARRRGGHRKNWHLRDGIPRDGKEDKSTPPSPNGPVESPK